MMSVRVTCSVCAMACRVTADLLGRVVRCPGCHRPFEARTAMSLKVSSASAVGRLRERNEDALLTQHWVWMGPDGRRETAVLLVADGMGGHNAGDRAAELAVTAVSQAMLPRLTGLLAGEAWDDEGAAESVDLALWEASRTILRAAEENEAYQGMGATAVAAWAFAGRLAVCHVGDCRAYLLQGDELKRLTQDQTLAQRMVNMGTLRPQEAENHPAAGQVWQALGRQADLEPSRLVRDFATGDVLLLCCDGLHGQVSDEVIKQTLREDDAAERLVRLAHAAGGKDNCTVALMRVG